VAARGPTCSGPNKKPWLIFSNLHAESIERATGPPEAAVLRTLDTVAHMVTAAVIADAGYVHVVDPARVPNPNWLRPGIPARDNKPSETTCLDVTGSSQFGARSRRIAGTSFFWQVALRAPTPWSSRKPLLLIPGCIPPRDERALIESQQYHGRTGPKRAVPATTYYLICDSINAGVRATVRT
jgi:hypothetical protein